MSLVGLIHIKGKELTVSIPHLGLFFESMPARKPGWSSTTMENHQDILQWDSLSMASGKGNVCTDTEDLPSFWSLPESYTLLTKVTQQSSYLILWRKKRSPLILTRTLKIGSLDLDLCVLHSKPVGLHGNCLTCWCVLMNYEFSCR